MVIIIVILVSLYFSLLVAEMEKEGKTNKGKTRKAQIYRSGFSHEDKSSDEGKKTFLCWDFIGTQKTIKDRKSAWVWVNENIPIHINLFIFPPGIAKMVKPDTKINIFLSWTWQKFFFGLVFLLLLPSHNELFRKTHKVSSQNSLVQSGWSFMEKFGEFQVKIFSSFYFWKLGKELLYT